MTGKGDRLIALVPLFIILLTCMTEAFRFVSFCSFFCCWTIPLWTERMDKPCETDTGYGNLFACVFLFLYPSKSNVQSRHFDCLNIPSSSSLMIACLLKHQSHPIRSHNCGMLYYRSAITCSFNSDPIRSFAALFCRSTLMVGKSIRACAEYVTAEVSLEAPFEV